MKRWVILILAVLAAAIPAAGGERGSGNDCPVHWLRTAVNQLPAERVIVFDPVSESFAFVKDVGEDCVSKDSTYKANQEYLDNHRLALTTQKIKLLILPYNPIFGKISVDSSLDDKAGPEFPDIPGLPAPAQTPTSPLKDKSLPAGKEPLTRKGKAVTPKNQMQPEVFNSLRDLSVQSLEIFQESAPDATVQLSQVLAAIDNDFRTDLGKATQTLELIRTDEICVEAGVRAIPLKVAEDFGRSCKSFSLGVTPSERAVLREAERRIKVLEEPDKLYKSCLGKSEFNEDARDLETRLSAVSLSSLSNQLDAMNRLIETLSGATRPQSVTEVDWKSQLSAWKESLGQDRDYFSALSKEKTDLTQQVASLRKSDEDVRRALVSAGTQLQVKFFSPLKDDQAITLKCTRAEPSADKSSSRKASSAQTVDCGSITLKSAPVQTFRFGSGIVVSHLYNPTFKVGPTTDNATDKKTIQYDDRGNGQVQLGLFVHNYWGHRSGLLSPTPFERFAPTFSLGIPLTKAELLQQVLIGLDWELVPGIELNVGAHWGKVNSLIDPYHVGQTISTKTDITSLQEKRFRAAFYGGIVLNADIFKKLFDSQTSSSGK